MPKYFRKPQPRQLLAKHKPEDLNTKRQQAAHPVVVPSHYPHEVATPNHSSLFAVACLGLFASSHLINQINHVTSAQTKPERSTYPYHNFHPEYNLSPGTKNEKGIPSSLKPAEVTLTR